MTLGVIAVAALAFKVFEPIQVLPRIRLAPSYSFVDGAGSVITSEDARGVVTLFSFAPADCGTECAEIDRTLDDVSRRVAQEVDLGGTEFRVATVVLDGVRPDPGPASVVRLYGADDMVTNVVGAGFEIPFEVAADGTTRFDRAYVLVDGWGVIRGEYRYRTIADDVDKLVRHVGLLAAEIRHADDATSIAYEAAHLFLCYP